MFSFIAGSHHELAEEESSVILIPDVSAHIEVCEKIWCYRVEILLKNDA